MSQVADIMNSNFVALDADCRVDEALAVLADDRISGAPVLADGRVIGMVTELDLLDVLFDPRLRERNVTAVMNTQAHSVDVAASLTQAAHIFALHSVRQLPVTRDGELVGTISRSALLRFACELDEPLLEPLAEMMGCSDEPT